MVKTYLAISGSLRKNSKNTALLRSIIALHLDNIKIEEFDISNIPLYNQDLEVIVDGQDTVFPNEVVKLREAVSNVHGLILITPEHNFSMSAAMKNIIDWLSRGTVLSGKTIALMSAGGSTGGSSATSSMKNIFEKLSWLNIKMVSREVNVKLFDGVEKFNQQNMLIHEETILNIISVVSELV